MRTTGDKIIDFVRIAFILIVIFIYWTYSHSNSQKFVEKMENYQIAKFLAGDKSITPIPQRIETSFDEVRFSIKDESGIKKVAYSTIKNMTLNDIKTVDDAKAVGALALIAIAPGDSIVCEIADSLKIKKCEKESLLGKNIPISNLEVKKILNLPESFFE